MGLTVDRVTHCPCAKTTVDLLYTRDSLTPRDSCLDPVPLCGQTCGKFLPCGPPSSPHTCPTPCHTGPCPPCPLTTSVRCSTQIKISCSCGHRQAGVPCSDNAYSRVTTALLATRMQDVQAGNSVDLAELTKRDRKLECNDDCMKIDRNSRMAAALQISNPELTSKVIPRYSEFMKDWVRRDATFCIMVHTKLTDLVKLAKESKQKSRAF